MSQQLPFVETDNGAIAHSSAIDDDEKGFREKVKKLFPLYDLARGSSIQNIVPNLMDGKSFDPVDFVKVLLFLRSPRDGKGEKDLFREIFLALWNKGYKKYATQLLSLVPTHGYWKDLNKIYVSTQDKELQRLIIELYVDQLVVDYNSIKKDSSGVNGESDEKKGAQTSSISLAGKWAPSEGSEFDAFSKDLAKALMKKLNKNTSTFRADYRKILTLLREKIGIIERFMCANKFADGTSDPSKIPSCAASRYSDALLNKPHSAFPKATRPRHVTIKKGERIEYGDEHYDDRDAARQNMIAAAAKGSINAAVTDLTTMVASYLGGSAKNEIWEAQWVKRLDELRGLLSTAPGGAGKRFNFLPMIDLSGSMASGPFKSYTPMDVAVTLGLIVSQLTTGTFAGKFLTFSTDPIMINLGLSSSLFGLVKAISPYRDGKYWGGSTDITKAFNLVIQEILQNSGSLDGLCVFSDMQFDSGDSSFASGKTQYQATAQKFHDLGLNMPHILFWNLNSSKPGFQAKANTPDTTLVSGYSTKMLNLFITGSLDKVGSGVDSVHLIKSVLDHEFKKLDTKSLEEAFALDLKDIYHDK